MARTGDLERVTVELLSRLEVPTNIRGYVLTKDAIVACLEDLDLIYTITKGLYPLVAEKNHTTATRVERNIRHLIELTWDHGNKNELISLFGPVTYHHKIPSNSFFIARLAEEIRLQRRKA